MKKIFTFFFVVAMTTGNAGAQYVVNFPFLIHHIGTRAAGMGNVQLYDEQSRVTTFGNVAAIFANPNRRFSVSYDLSVFRKVEDSRLLNHGISASYLYQNHAISVGSRICSGFTAQARNELGDIYDIHPHESTIDLAYAYRFCPAFSAFIGVNYIHAYNGRSADGVSFSVGAFHKGSYCWGILQGDYAVGTYANNIGPKVSYSESKVSYALPTYVGIQPSTSVYVTTNQTLSLALSGGKVLSSESQPLLLGAGLEYKIRHIALRTGYYKGYEKYFTLGVGAELKHFFVDIAYSMAENNDFNICKLGLAYHF